MTTEEYCESINVQIVHAKEEARKAGKPLLMIYGESHHDDLLLIQEGCLLKSAASLNTKNFAPELDTATITSLRDEPADQRNSAFEFTIPMADLFGMHVTGMDQTISHDGNYQPTAKSNQERENNGMIPSLLAMKGDTLAISGAIHLKGLAESKELQNKFYIMPLISSTLARPPSPPTQEATEEEKFMYERQLYNATSPKITRLPAPTGISEKNFFSDLLGDKLKDYFSLLAGNPTAYEKELGKQKPAENSPAQPSQDKESRPELGPAEAVREGGFEVESALKTAHKELPTEIAKDLYPLGELDIQFFPPKNMTTQQINETALRLGEKLLAYLKPEQSEGRKALGKKYNRPEAEFEIGFIEKEGVDKLKNLLSKPTQTR